MTRVLARRAQADVKPVLVLVCITLVGVWDVIAGATLLSMDTGIGFYPWFTFLGHSLRAGTIPGWNPHQFAGTPFAADPESGWMYVPAMAAFTLLPPAAAAKTFIVLHVLLAGVFAYALARTLGAAPVAAVLAGETYALSGFLFGHAVCCFAFAGVAVWLPLVLLGAERAIRGQDWWTRGAWWGLAGLGLSQIFAAWVGQGAYYAVLLLGAHLLYRTLLAPACPHSGLWTRLGNLLMHGAGCLLFAVALAAAGLFPRLEFNALSNLPGGYPDSGPDTAASLTDWGFIRDWDVILFTPGFHYAGIWAFALALVAPVVGLRRLGVALFVAKQLPSVIASDKVPVKLERGHTLVYEDQDVQIFESPDALPHFRIVYGAQEVRPGDALALLTSGTIDSRHTTILEVPPPPLEQPAADAHEQVELMAYEANRIQVRMTTTAPGMLVVSEVHYPAWRATVDGKAATVYVADHIFRAVPIPEGTHMVELRYASETLQVGLVVSVCAVGLLLGLMVGAVRRRARRSTDPDQIR